MYRDCRYNKKKKNMLQVFVHYGYFGFGENMRWMNDKKVVEWFWKDLASLDQ
jgi:hypothetical protein